MIILLFSMYYDSVFLDKILLLIHLYDTLHNLKKERSKSLFKSNLNLHKLSINYWKKKKSVLISPIATASSLYIITMANDERHVRVARKGCPHLLVNRQRVVMSATLNWQHKHFDDQKKTKHFDLVQKFWDEAKLFDMAWQWSHAKRNISF